ncbi:MAG TPA: sarcosine oxidase subunit delta [Beijerinckiaceae bacterium]|jgi:sarcosine oxidase subunit delta
MLLIPCPHCGAARPEREFVYGGEAGLIRPADPAQASDGAWTDYLFRRDNLRGPQDERWRHVHGCGRFIIVRRDTATDRVLASRACGDAP